MANTPLAALRVSCLEQLCKTRRAGELPDPKSLEAQNKERSVFPVCTGSVMRGLPTTPRQHLAQET